MGQVMMQQELTPSAEDFREPSSILYIAVSVESLEVAVVPVPREPAGQGPTDPFPEDHELWQTVANAMAQVRDEVQRWQPIVYEILEEANSLVPANPSASVVWSVQALEVFLKRALLGPALLVRLQFDAELTNEIFDSLLGRNGANAAKKWLGHMFGISDEYWMSSGLAALRTDVFRERGIVSWRNKIVHEGHKASEEEARKALHSIRSFIEHIETFFAH